MALDYPEIHECFTSLKQTIKTHLPYGGLFGLAVTLPNGITYSTLIDLQRLSHHEMNELEVCNRKPDGRIQESATIKIKYTAPDAPYVTIHNQVEVAISVLDPDADAYLENY
jgi:hypothetical protein